MGKSKSDELFIIVEGFTFSFSLLTIALSFVENASNNDEREFLGVAWKKTPNWVTEIYDKLPFMMRKCKIPNVPFTLNLLTFPISIPRDFSMDDLQFPFNISGLILTFDLSLEPSVLDRAKENDAPESISNWAQRTRTPFVGVVTSLEPSQITVEEMRVALNLPLTTPILSYTDKKRTDPDFHFYSGFEQENTYEVLTQLIDLIQARST